MKKKVFLFCLLFVATTKTEENDPIILSPLAIQTQEQDSILDMLKSILYFIQETLELNNKIIELGKEKDRDFADLINKLQNNKDHFDRKKLSFNSKLQTIKNDFNTLQDRLKKYESQDFFPIISNLLKTHPGKITAICSPVVLSVGFLIKIAYNWWINKADKKTKLFDNDEINELLS